MSGLEPSYIPKDYFNNAVLEPVHFASSIQPHGVLFVLSNSELVILQTSANVENYFGVSPQDLIGQPLGLLLDGSEITLIQQELNRLNHSSSNRFRRSSLRLWQNGQSFNGVLYRSFDCIVLELELAIADSEVQPLQLHRRVKQAIAQLRQVSDLTEFLQQATTEIRHLTGFDRVMVYQFDSQGAGAVVAEAKRDDLSPYLGLHYPATDIPEPVRTLYRQGMVRYIPDIEAQSIELIPVEHPLAQPPLDLTLSILRSVDPCCVEYHRNMDVSTILVIALTQGETLWGLVSCHHQTPKLVPYEVREGCELFGHLIALELTNKVNTEELQYLTKLRSLQSEFIQSISQADDLKQALVTPAPRLLDLVGAQGAAICLESEITLVGTTPSLEQVHALVQWAETRLSHHAPFHTNSLPKLYAEAEAFKDTASGLLVLQISKVRRYTILWFRPEVLQTVNWAGDPNTSINVAADGSVTLCPRKSFEQWQQIVRFTSLSWKDCEIENALDLRSAIVGIVLKKADELARVNKELERTVQELDSFAYAASHDLKEPLRGIHNFSNLLLKGYCNILDDVGQSRLETLIRLTRRMESLIDALLKFSRLGQAELHLQPIDLNQLLHQVLEDLWIGRPDLQTEIRIPRPLPRVNCDPILMQEVLTNLLSNAVKYNDKSEQWIEIGYIEGNQAPTIRHQELFPTPHSLLPIPYIFYVRDNGIGIRERHLNSVFRLFKRLHEQHLYGGGTGAGLAIAKKIIERHSGQIWVESVYGEGSTFYFTLGTVGFDATIV
jgi:light-regulated signal transduction histidine kinase (bacteriophytochrome)